MRYLEGFIAYETYRPKIRFSSERIDFNYRLSGSGDEVILTLLESSMFKTTAYYQLLQILETKYKVLVIEDLNPVYDHQMIIKGIKGLLDALSYRHIHLLGMNLGGSLALMFAKYDPIRIKSLILYHSIVHTSFMNKEAKDLKEQLLKTIDDVKDLRKIMSLDDIKIALMAQIKDFITHIEDIDQEQAYDYFEYLMSQYQTNDETYQMQRIKDFLLSEPLDAKSFEALSKQSYILYGDDEDPFYGPMMLEIAVDLFNNPKVEYLKHNRFEIILKPEQFANKILEHIKEKD